MSDVPSPLPAILRAVFDQPGNKGRIPPEAVKQMMEALDTTDVHVLMVALLPIAKTYARPPISRFQVGAVALGTSGSLYLGCNVEFAGQALSFTVHAEQSAVTNAWANGETGLASLAVSAAPCGYCRQYLYELVTARQLVVVLPGVGGTPVARPLVHYLPDPFGPGDLGVEGGLMEPIDHPLRLDRPTDDPLVQAALQAARRSYAPYTKGYAAIAVETDRDTYAAPYCDNAAFNPAMSPMEAALSWVNVNEGTFGAIRRVVLVQAYPTLCDQTDASGIVLRTVSDVPLEVFTATTTSA